MHYNKNKLNKECSKYKIEITEVKGYLLFSCPHMPNDKVRKQLSDIVKDIECLFIESPKKSTEEALLTVLRDIGFTGTVYAIGRKVTFITKMEAPDDHPLWTELPEIINRDGYFDSYEITIGHRTITYPPLRFSISKPTERDHHPTKDEIIDLNITLGGPDRDVLDIIKEL